MSPLTVLDIAPSTPYDEHMILSYLAGLATLPALALAYALISQVVSEFTSTSQGWGCNVCDERWGFEGDGSVIAVARFHSWKHHTFRHPGGQARVLVAFWRGWGIHSWSRRKRLTRAFPAGRVTPLDIIARLPLISGWAFKIARRHGDKINAVA